MTVKNYDDAAAAGVVGKFWNVCSILSVGITLKMFICKDVPVVKNKKKKCFTNPYSTHSLSPVWNGNGYKHSVFRFHTEPHNLRLKNLNILLGTIERLKN